MLEIPTLRGTTARKRAALEEMRMIAEWARADTAEWVRAIGALSEEYARDAEGPRLGAQFESLVRGLLRPSRSRYSDLEALVRQLRERDYHRAAHTAATIAVEVDPGSSYFQSVLANCAALIGDDRAAALHDRRCAELLEEGGDADTEKGWRRVIVRANTIGDVELARFAADKAEAVHARPPVPKEPEPPEVNWLLLSMGLGARYPEAADAEAAPPLVTPPTASELDAYERADHTMWATLLCLLLRRRPVEDRAVETPRAVIDAFLARRGVAGWVAIADEVCQAVLGGGSLPERALGNLKEWLSGELDEELEAVRKTRKLVDLIKAAKISLAFGRWEEATQNVEAARAAIGHSRDAPGKSELSRITAAVDFAHGQYEKGLSDLKSTMLLEAIFGADRTPGIVASPDPELSEHEAALREVASMFTRAREMQDPTLQRALARLCAALPEAEGHALSELVAAQSAVYEEPDKPSRRSAPKRRTSAPVAKKKPAKKSPSKKPR